MALPLSYGVDTQVSVPGSCRFGEAGIVQLYQGFSKQKKCKVVELNVQVGHVHLIVSILLMLSVSNYVGMVKSRTAVRVLQRIRGLRTKPYLGQSNKGYCVDTEGLDLEKIQYSVRYKEKKDQQIEQRQLGL